jgi:hypothetical protein
MVSAVVICPAGILYILGVMWGLRAYTITKYTFSLVFMKRASLLGKYCVTGQKFILIILFSNAITNESYCDYNH